MAFFGLTHLGYQDAIREHMNNPVQTPQNIHRSGLYRDKSKVHLPPIDPKEKKAASLVPTDQLSGYGPGHQGSYVEFTRMRTKHIRNPEGPTDTYRWPLATSGEISRWRKDEPLREKEPWAYVRRHVHTNSEMTRFVDEMALTNRGFSLF